eukprot:TRINITY_DN42900_c0_g1_i1.p1 TRINITY_DN42900_c0_g1~~TRINITY_DN42900_c0_g1_i1.p1  ORF type:complete len:310 (-),score=163.59 TRINITY_DN42900_c0_g1_i1:38-895(-)
MVAIMKEGGVEAKLLENYKEKSELLAAVADVDGMIIRSDKVDEEVHAAGKNLKLVIRAGAGTDNVVGPVKKAICVQNTPGQNSNAVAELAFGMMLNVCRAKYTGKAGFELKGKTLGLIAFGHVARCMATIAKGFGMKVVAYVRPNSASKALLEPAGVEYVAEVAEVYKQSDFVSLNMPSTAETKGSVNKAMLDLCKNKAVLINTARPDVVNEADLLEALKAKNLYYVADVAPKTREAFETEVADKVFFTAKKCGAQTAEANSNAGIASANQAVAFFKGEIMNQVC